MPALSRWFPLCLGLSLLFTTAAQGGSDGVGYYPNGQVQWEYLYQDGAVREAKWYDEQGRLQARALFADGRQAMAEGYRGDGTLAWQSKALAEGREEVTRFGPGRRPEIRYQVSDGQADGQSTVFHANGLPRQTVTFRRGVPDGPAQTFYEDGRLESDYHYRDGRLDGPYRGYSPDGQPAVEQLFSKGRLQ